MWQFRVRVPQDVRSKIGKSEVSKSLGTSNYRDAIGQPFAPWQLQKIFDAPLYRGCRNDGAGYATPGNDKPRRGRFWVPLIALFSGMRLNEICQLNVEDVRVVDGIHCFIVTTD